MLTACSQEQVTLKRIFHLELALENKWICMTDLLDGLSSSLPNCC